MQINASFADPFRQGRRRVAMRESNNFVRIIHLIVLLIGVVNIPDPLHAVTIDETGTQLPFTCIAHRSFFMPGFGPNLRT